ncbi:hypothetical protein FBY21_1598 [Pseudomonas sp. SLBN-26]|uniref:hypothetical protein n=1 Tax=Pseudomonadaceae TaxID=135621 RepID=UPI00114E476A|nr:MULTISPECIES: hypothetical protein [Pseudomonas]MCP1617000.1 hypothetical protein [Pseudomonas otitidis]TQL06244.1 hypothetical protein FBY21_1598 [Pseudomonas sp. SLBN-26]
MSWYERAWQHMHQVHQQALAEGLDAIARARAIDDSYPWQKRSGWPYKAWLRARRDFFPRHQLPTPRATRPGPDLFSE